MSNVHVPFSFLWSLDGSFERRRWPPRAQSATAVYEESYQVKLIRLGDKRPEVQMRWVGMIDVNGEFSLRTEWASFKTGNHYLS
jgi:hypothetical protein